MTGFYDAKTVLKKGIASLILKLQNVNSEFKNLDNSSKISIKNNNLNDIDFYYFVIEDENETIGELLTTYCTSDKNISYCGYIIEHPLKKNI